MSSSMDRKRPTLDRAVKARQLRPMNDEDDEAEPRPTPASRRNKRAKSSVVQPEGTALFADHDDVHGADSSLSLTNLTHTTYSSSLSSLSTPESSPTPQRQDPILSPSMVMPCTTVLLEPYGQPPVWAEERQSICEALPYFRSYQSGSYAHENLAYAFLLDKDSGERAYMDEEVVITRAGGGCTVGETGTMQQSGDQSRSAAHIAAFFNNTNQRAPIVTIVGSSNASCRVSLPHRYCVMDWFQVTDIWAEKSNGKTCFKFRLEKIRLWAISWWAPTGAELPPAPRDFVTKAARLTCDLCHKVSIQVFDRIWMCLNEVCEQFWKVNGSEAPAGLTYNPLFLGERSLWPTNRQPAFRIRPKPIMVNLGYADLSYSLASWKGMVCPQCGRCNSRILWREWRCANPSCNFSHQIQLTPVSALSVLPDHGVEFEGKAPGHNKWDSNVIDMREPIDLGEWKKTIYQISEGNTITHYQANRSLNAIAGGANDMFRELQQADMGLQRFPLANSPIQGEMLTKHFASNFGMPYKYIVAVNSKSFKDAPQAIMDGLAKLTWAGKNAVGDTPGDKYQDCNELLALGYFEKQSIKYHDDGEKDLGPTIATMSLGGSAVMTVRMKENFYSVRKHDVTKPVLRGCQLFDERNRLKADHDRLSATEFAKSKLQFGRDAQKHTKRMCAPILTMRLRHGDMVVMHGHAIQKYYEHQVVPQGKLRFALTTRYVNPETIPENERWKGDFNPFPRAIFDELESRHERDDADELDNTDPPPGFMDGTDHTDHLDVMADADSTIANDISFQSSAENGMPDDRIVDKKSADVGFVSVNQTTDAIGVDSYAPPFSAAESAGFDSSAQSSSAPQQNLPIDPMCLDLPSSGLGLYNGSTSFGGEALEHPYVFDQPLETDIQNSSEHTSMPDPNL